MNAVARTQPLHGSDSSRELAPVALFVYNRPEHTRRTVESLRENDLARSSDLFVFSDGAKTRAAAAGVQKVREFVPGIDGFKTVTIIERERNWGLANSVIAGVSQLCEERGRVIVVEDDLLTAQDFLMFMNLALERYQEEPRIFSVSGFNFPIAVPASYPYDAFCSYRSISWGWGTWEDRWQRADWSVSDYVTFRTDKRQQQLFNRGGEDLSRMLALQMDGRIDSWSIRWDYTHFKHNAVALFPVISRVYNFGFDGSGVHCRRGTLQQARSEPGSYGRFRFPNSAETDPQLNTAIQKLHRPSLFRKCAWYVKDRWESR